MNTQLKPGKYVIAVSGGVDSVVLLHVLQKMPDVELIVAHFDHGIRADSHEDRKFVEGLARKYDLPFETAAAHLGPGTSEATAREARYKFLNRVKAESGAQAIITAHHQDDVLETAIINMLRGTYHKGLSALRNREGLDRPLLGVSKSEIVQYAQGHKLQWREDSTNLDESYLRNYVRQQILPRFGNEARIQLLKSIEAGASVGQAIDTSLVKYMKITGNTLDRQQFIMLPHEVAREVMATWLRANGLRDFDRKTLERLVVAAKVAQPGAQFDVLQKISMRVDADLLALLDMER